MPLPVLVPPLLGVLLKVGSGMLKPLVRMHCAYLSRAAWNAVLLAALKPKVIPLRSLEHAVREDLNARCRRAMGVLRPLRVVLENYPEGEEQSFDAPWSPDDPARGSRRIPF